MTHRPRAANRSIIGRNCAVAGRLVGLVLFAATLATASPATAFSGADLLRDVCLATFPDFDGASKAIAAFHGRATTYNGRIFEQVDADRRLAWTATDDPGVRPDRFLIGVAWGTLNSQPAASCFVADKKAFALADLKNELAIKQLRVSPKKMLYATVADAIVERRRDGRRLWLTLTLSPGHDDPTDGSAIAVATLMSSAYLNALMEKGP